MLTTIGLRHVLEDGIEILNGRNLKDSNRQLFVLNYLKTIIFNALLGSRIIGEPALAFGHPVNTKALKTFTVLYKIYGRYRHDKLNMDLRDTFISIQVALDGRIFYHESAINLLKRVLERLDLFEGL